MQAILTFATILMPIVTGVTQFIKAVFPPMPKNFVPIVALAAGLVIGFLAVPLTHLDWMMRLWGGGLAGLAATGFYEIAFNPRIGSTKNKSGGLSRKSKQ
ncbi:holin [Camelliibacillus cellulosilyticus]|uniref:Holin n=1 Tax=Camelliibacillus cellulosilyticus TaxID=2174486 RepID=A0ABV9GP17_9BACL